jgi:conjugative relaxase-like TrwC/TraI family protein
MLSISHMAGGQGVYYTGLAREDYYLNGGEPPGLWFGAGAGALGLKGEVDKEIFTKLFEGYDAHGHAIVRNAGEGDNRKAGWDLTFSAPKSVSVLWSLLPKDQGAEIRAAHEAAVKAACRYLEENAAWTRRGKLGLLFEKAHLVIGLFEHGTSRAGDPQLHTHALFLNAVVRADGTTGSLYGRDFYRHKMAAGALYRAELAAQLQQRLGLEIDRVSRWFEVRGVNTELTAHWSKRRKEIETALFECGYSSPRAAEKAALATRHTKLHVAREKLFGEWAQVGEQMGWGRKAALGLCRAGASLFVEASAWDRAQLLKKSVEELTAQQSYFTERDLVRKMAEHGQGQGFGAKQVLETVKNFIEGRAIALGTHRGHALFTTQSVLELEKNLLDRISASKDATRHQVSERVLERQLGKHSHLNEEQKAAVAHITTKVGDVSVVAGMAGTGKTTMLQAAADVWRAAGFEVRGAALAGKAADGLATEAGIPSATLAKTLYMAEQSHKLGSTFTNPLTKNTILVVDEAGMVGTLGMSRLLDEAAKAKAKVVLVGDARQLQPIEAGGPFASIAKRLGEAVLTTIIRQNEEWARTAVHHMADGEARQALSAFAERGRLSISETRTQARHELLEAWRKDGIARPKDNLILVGTNTEAAQMNKAAQSLRVDAGELGRLRLSVGGDTFRKHDRILFTKNSGPLGVKNGQLGTVTHVDCVAQTLYVQLDNKRKVQIPIQHYKDIKLGYAVTTHKSQGMTAENAFVLTSTSMQDKELSYVQASRARESTRIFTTKVEAGEQLSELSAVMSRSRQKELASDLIGRREAVEDVLKEHRERQTLGARLGHRLGLTP